MNSRISHLACFFACAAFAGSARAEVVRLADLERRALTQQAVLLRQKARERGASARVELAQAGARPTFALKADAAIAPGSSLVSVNDVHGEEYWVAGSLPFGRARAFTPVPRYGSSLSVQGNLYDFGRSRDRVRASEGLLNATQAESEDSRADILRDVRAAFLGWLIAANERALAEKNATSAEERQGTSRGRVEEGARPPSDLLAIRTENARARLRVAETHGRETAARLRLEVVSAGPIEETAQPDPSLLDLGPPNTTPSRPIGLLALERRRDAALATARAHDHAFAPILAGAAEAGVRAQNELFFPAYRVSVELSIPLWDGGSEVAQHELANAEALELSAAVEDLSRTLVSEAKAAEADWQSAEQQVRAAEELARASDAMLKSADDRYALSASTLESVIDARAQLTAASLEVLHARAARAQAALRLQDLNARTIGAARSSASRTSVP